MFWIVKMLLAVWWLQWSLKNKWFLGSKISTATVVGHTSLLFPCIPIFAPNLVGTVSNFEFGLCSAQAVGSAGVWLLVWSKCLRKKTQINKPPPPPPPQQDPRLNFCSVISMLWGLEIIRQQEMQKSFPHTGNWAVKPAIMGCFLEGKTQMSSECK